MVEVRLDDENLGEWPFKRGPISKIGPSDGCGRDAVPLAVGKWYDFHEFGWHLGNVGSLTEEDGPVTETPSILG